MTRPGRAPALAVVTLGLALLALAAPLGRAEFPTPRVGWLLAFASAIEMLHAMRRSEAAARRRAAVGAIISMAIALFLINAPFVASQALRWLIAGWFGVDGVRHAIGAARRSDANERRHAILSALGNGAVALLLVFSRGGLLAWIVAAAGALRIFGIAWSILAAPVYATSEADETVIERARALGRARGGRDGRRGRRGRADARAHRPWLDDRVHRDAVCDSHRPHAHRPDVSRH